MIRLLSALRRFCRANAGTATIEFVILFPVFMVITVSAIELGVLTVRQIMVERGIDVTVRALRLGTLANPTYERVRNAICANAIIIRNCAQTLHLELTPVSTETWDVPDKGVDCVDRTHKLDPVVKFDTGLRNEFMLMRACAVFTPLVPAYGLGPSLPVDSSGGYHIIASTSFVNEP